MAMVDIRPEQPADEAAIAAVHGASFPTDAEARLVAALRADGDLIVSLVAVASGEVVGHVAFSPVRVNGAAGGVGLGPVAVLAAHRSQGVAERLIREGLDACKQRGATFAVVLGDPRYYGRFGFIAASRFGLQDEYGGGDAFQALELEPGAIAPNAGLVRYANAFSLVT